MSKTYLTTDRVTLRRFEEKDVIPLLEMDLDPAVSKYLDSENPMTLEREQGFVDYVIEKYPEGQPFGFWIAQLHDGTFLGWFHFRPHRKDPQFIELGYRLCQAHWGRGYATEVSRALIEKGFREDGVEVVVGETLAENLGSRRVMEKAGMIFAFEFLYDDRLRAVRYQRDRP